MSPHVSTCSSSPRSPTGRLPQPRRHRAPAAGRHRAVRGVAASSRTKRRSSRCSCPVQRFTASGLSSARAIVREPSRMARAALLMLIDARKSPRPRRRRRGRHRGRSCSRTASRTRAVRPRNRQHGSLWAASDHHRRQPLWCPCPRAFRSGRSYSRSSGSISAVQNVSPAKRLRPRRERLRNAGGFRHLRRERRRRKELFQLALSFRIRRPCWVWPLIIVEGDLPTTRVIDHQGRDACEFGCDYDAK